MITCQACQKLSPLDSRFCPSCGTTLDDRAIQAALDEFQLLLNEGAKLLTENRVAEAMLVAEKAVDDNPASADAFSLLGDCHERNGDLRGALEAYDRVVELNPSSPLDRIKLAHLRDLFEQRAVAQPRGQHRAAWAAGAAVVMVACFGAAVAMFNQPQEQVVSVPQYEQDASAPAYAMNTPTNSGAPNGSVQPVTQSPATQPTQENPSRPASNPQLPPADRPTSTGFEQEGPIGPLRVRPDGTLPSTAPQTKPNTGDPEPAPVKPNTANPSGANPNPTTARTNRPPVYEITTSSQSNPTHGSGSTPVSNNPNDASNMVRVARQHYAAGNYEKAADAYEKALRMGGDPASCNQRLAQCYERMGRKADAINAYRDAAAAFEQNIAKGRGDSGANQAGLDSCRQALRTLGA